MELKIYTYVQLSANSVVNKLEYSRVNIFYNEKCFLANFYGNIKQL